MNVSDTLNLAADLIERDGWTSGPSGMLTDGPHCLEGAIQAANGTKAIFPDEYPYLESHPCEAGNAVRNYLNVRPSDHPCYWNDAPERTAIEVVEVLRATALIEAARERETAEVTR